MKHYYEYWCTKTPICGYYQDKKYYTTGWHGNMKEEPCQDCEKVLINRMIKLQRIIDRGYNES